MQVDLSMMAHYESYICEPKVIESMHRAMIAEWIEEQSVVEVKQEDCSLQLKKQQLRGWSHYKEDLRSWGVFVNCSRSWSTVQRLMGITNTGSTNRLVR